jgi:alpha-mannosidase
MDGKFLIVEDYLEVKPQMRQTVAELNAHGKISLGQFYSQPDVFLSSGEALIRNLMLGMSLSSNMGGRHFDSWISGRYLLWLYRSDSYLNYYVVSEYIPLYRGVLQRRVQQKHIGWLPMDLQHSLPILETGIVMPLTRLGHIRLRICKREQFFRISTRI